MTKLYLDAFSGISGDMFIGALLDLGIDFKAFKDQLARLHVSGYELTAERVAHSSIYGTNFDTVLAVAGKDDAPVSAEEAHAHHHHGPHRHLKDITELIDKSDLSAAVKRHSIAVFTDIAQAEAKVHHMPLDDVHFHEVGAWIRSSTLSGRLWPWNFSMLTRFIARKLLMAPGSSRLPTVSCRSRFPR